MTYGQLIFFTIPIQFSILVQGVLLEPVVRMIAGICSEIFSSGGLGANISSKTLENEVTDFNKLDGQT